MTENKEKNVRILISVVLVVIVILALFYLFFVDRSYTTEYEEISAEEAYVLFKSNPNLIILDVRGLEGLNESQYLNGHLPDSNFDKAISELFNEKKDILIYSNDGTKAKEICKELEGKVYGKIYNLEGGYESWDAEGYPTSDIYYINLSVEEAYELINETADITIIDCRGLDYSCISCLNSNYKSYHLKNSILEDYPATFENNTNDILVYSKNGATAPGFCESLIKHVDVKVYNMVGGIEAWKAAGYPTQSTY